MRRVNWFVTAVLSAGIVLAVAPTATPAAPLKATAVLTSATGDDEFGTVTFTQTDSASPTKISGQLKGLPPGSHGFTIHENGALTNGCSDAGAHYNPLGKDHGGPGDTDRHVGDLGNIVADDDSEAKVDIVDKVVSLDGEYSVVGRSIVIHIGEDDLGQGETPDSKRTGHSGRRVACGVIKLVH